MWKELNAYVEGKADFVQDPATRYKHAGLLPTVLSHYLRIGLCGPVASFWICLAAACDKQGRSPDDALLGLYTVESDSLVSNFERMDVDGKGYLLPEDCTA